MIAVLITLLAVAIVVLVVISWASQPAAGARPSEVVYVDEDRSRWDPWGWWPVGPWTPHWNPHPFNPPVPPHRPVGPLGPGGERHLLGPGGERRLMGGARRGGGLA